ncbi:MAG: hypothetical protein M3N39_00395, partial [Pseudomonadota bacterium]|nr:hypothetical protein [Pseudomonadota bacterium]
MAKNQGTVSVCSKSRLALEEPRFLIEADGKLYLTLAVLEYDPKHPKIRKEHEAIIEDLHVHLKKGAKSR